MVAGQAGVASALVVAGAAGLAAVATAVDGGGGLSPLDALLVGGLRVPGLLLPLLPVLCALGAGVAAARQVARGERRALALAGHDPALPAGIGLAVALAFGVSGWVAHDRLVPPAEAHADAIGGRGDAPWVFVGAEVVRVEDGLVVRVEDDAIVGTRHLEAHALDAPALRAAAAAQRPARAPHAVLAASDERPARTERGARWSRILAGGLLAFFAWLPVARSPAAQAGVALVGGLTWAAADVGLRAAAAQGRVGAGTGAWGAIVVALALALAALLWTRRTRALPAASLSAP